MKKIVGILFSLLLVSAMSACTSNNAFVSIEGYDLAEGQKGIAEILDTFSLRPTSYGFYYKVMDDGQGQARFYDYASKQSVPVCSRPNCPHDLSKDDACDAYRWNNALYEYESVLYCPHNTGTNYSEMYTYAKDFSNETLLFSVEADLNGMLFAEDKLFYVADTQSISVTGSVGIEKSEICVFDLNAKTHTTLVTTEADVSNRILYADEASLVYMSATPCDFDPLAITADTVLSEAELRMYRFDTQEDTLITSFGMCTGSTSTVYNGVLYYNAAPKKPLLCYDLATGGTGEIKAGEKMDLIGFIGDGKIFCFTAENAREYYDIASAETHAHHLSSDETLNWWIVSERQECFILSTQRMDETALHVSTLTISKADFYKENVLDNPANYDVIYAYDQLWE